MQTNATFTMIVSTKNHWHATPLAPDSLLSSGDQRALFYAIESNEPCDCGKLVTFVLRHHVVKVTYSVFQPAMSKKRTILSSSLDQQIEILGSLDEARRVEEGACWCGKTQIIDKWHASNANRRVEFGRPG